MQPPSLLTFLTLTGLAAANPLSNPSPETLPATVSAVALSAARVAELEAFAATNSSDAALSPRQGSCTWTAYGGDFCNGGVGGAITIGSSGICIRAEGRHSFYVSSGCPRLGNIYYDRVDCKGGYTASGNGPGCYNVNTGRGWGSSYVYRT